MKLKWENMYVYIHKVVVDCYTNPKLSSYEASKMACFKQY